MLFGDGVLFPLEMSVISNGLAGRSGVLSLGSHLDTTKDYTVQNPLSFPTTSLVV